MIYVVYTLTTDNIVNQDDSSQMAIETNTDRDITFVLRSRTCVILIAQDHSNAKNTTQEVGKGNAKMTRSDTFTNRIHSKTIWYVSNNIIETNEQIKTLENSFSRGRSTPHDKMNHFDDT